MVRISDYPYIFCSVHARYLHEGEEGRAVSAAEYIEDVNDTPVILIDGLTKNWRCPGWRVCWVVGVCQFYYLFDKLIYLFCFVSQKI